MCLNPETSFGATGFEAISPRHLPTAKNNPIYLFIGGRVGVKFDWPPGKD